MTPFSQWLLTETLSSEVADKLKQLLASKREVAGYIRGNEVHLLNQGGEGNVDMGQADDLRSLDCDSTFHTHNRPQDIPYPSGKDVVAVYMTGKPDLVVTLKGVWAVTPAKQMKWQQVERISNWLWLKAQEQNSQEPYWIWKASISKQFPVKIEKVYTWPNI